MRFVLFAHSLVSDWNHGNAHFLRGIVRALQARGHEVRSFEPADGWSRTNLLADQGELALRRFARDFPDIHAHTYDPLSLDLDAALEGADVVLVHEWNDSGLVARIGRHRLGGGRYLLLFHDTHHRAASDAAALGAIGLEAYDGVLAFGEAVREAYLRHGWARRVWTWHEAADVSIFRPCGEQAPEADLVWVGNWGDDERTAELRTFLLEPAQATRALRDVLEDRDLARGLAATGLATIRARHTCAHRVEELLSICGELSAGEAAPRAQAGP
jgi:spore maturation protein CgeB